MIIQKNQENRLEYLTRVLYHYFQNNPVNDYTIQYDGTECDGSCLIDDLLIELGLTAEEIEGK